MPTTASRRFRAALGPFLAAGVLLVAAAHPLRAQSPAPTRAKPQSVAPALQSPFGAHTVITKLGRALLEERDAQINLRTETYRDEIDTASARADVKPPAGPARG